MGTRRKSNNADGGNKTVQKETWEFEQSTSIIRE